jgi:hypothetical protein
MSDQTAADIVELLRREMLVKSRPIEFDLTVANETGEIQLATDDWTLGIENLATSPSAWIAIDGEPDHPNEYERAREDSFRPHEIAALRRANLAIDGVLADWLNASQDPFSAYMASVLAQETQP